jgi:Domain of unknown function (DUF4911)
MTAALKTAQKILRVNRKQIAFLKFIFEAYDGLALLSTLDPESGLMMFKIAPGCETDVEMILQDLAKTVMIERIDLDNLSE